MEYSYIPWWIHTEGSIEIATEPTASVHAYADQRGEDWKIDQIVIELVTEIQCICVSFTRDKVF